MRIKKSYLFYPLIIAVGLVVVGFFLARWSDQHIKNFSKPYHFKDYHLLKKKKVGVVLGTSSKLTDGSPNPYFENRMNAAADLYKNGVVEFLIVSGDNATIYYNEPIQMRKALVKRGVPIERIFLDFAGFRTFDSMIRANKVFGQHSFIVISQSFHNERAVFIARNYGIEVYGYDAKDVDPYRKVVTDIREYFARLLAVGDVYLWEAKPKFLGDQIIIKVQKELLPDSLQVNDSLVH